MSGVHGAHAVAARMAGRAMDVLVAPRAAARGALEPRHGAGKETVVTYDALLLLAGAVTAWAACVPVAGAILRWKRWRFRDGFYIGCKYGPLGVYLASRFPVNSRPGRAIELDSIRLERKGR